MSIFGSLGAPDASEHNDDCAIWDKSADGTWEYSDRPCSCGQPDAPLVYQGSHHLPAEGDERGGYVDLASIPSHITRNGRDDKPEDGKPWPFLRFGVNEGVVILTRHHVSDIHATLERWLEETA